MGILKAPVDPTAKDIFNKDDVLAGVLDRNIREAGDHLLVFKGDMGWITYQDLGNGKLKRLWTS